VLNFNVEVAPLFEPVYEPFPLAVPPDWGKVNMRYFPTSVSLKPLKVTTLGATFLAIHFAVATHVGVYFTTVVENFFGW
jgi:hypothetical protein